MMDDNIILKFDSLENGDIDITVPTPIRGGIPHSLSALFERDYLTYNDFEKLEQSLADFRGLREYQFLYRGHADSSFQLLASSARKNVINDGIELKILESFKSKAKTCYQSYKMDGFDDDLFYMGIGRHLGLDCRILDWTACFWTAVSFLLYDHQDCDGDLWIMGIPRSRKTEKCSPFSITDDKLHILTEDYYIPELISEAPAGLLRRLRQNGFFSVTSDAYLSTPLNLLPKESLCGIELYKIHIPVCVKQNLSNYNKIVPVNDWLYGKQHTCLSRHITNLNNRHFKKTDIIIQLQCLSCKLKRKAAEVFSRCK